MAGKLRRPGLVTTGLIGHWSFDQQVMSPLNSTTNLILDDSGSMLHAQANNSTVAGLATSVGGIIKYQGRPGLALGGLQTLAASSSLRTVARQWPQTGFSIAAWIQPDASQPSDCLICSVYGSVNAYMTFILSGTKIELDIQQVQDVQTVGRVGGSSDLAPNGKRWYHVLGTWDGGTTNASVKIYTNGLRTDTTDTGVGTFTGPYTGSDLHFEIGSFNNGSRPFLGNIDDIRMYNRPLNAAEAFELFSEGYKTNAGIDSEFWPGFDALGWLVPAVPPVPAISQFSDRTPVGPFYPNTGFTQNSQLPQVAPGILMGQAML